MAGSDLEVVLDWAAGEAWNPGRHDAAAFEAIDPDGLLIGLVNGEPVAAIACPRYDERYRFVGLYLVRDDHRGSSMYRGRAPDYERSTVFGVSTLELG